MKTIGQLQPGDEVFFASYAYPHLNGRGIVRTTVHSVSPAIYPNNILLVIVNADKRFTFRIYECTNDLSAIYANPYYPAAQFVAISTSKQCLKNILKDRIGNDANEIEKKLEEISKEYDKFQAIKVELNKSMNKL